MVLNYGTATPQTRMPRLTELPTGATLCLLALVAALAASPIAGGDVGVRAQLVAFYTEHNPEKLGGLDKLMAHFAGREQLLLDKVRATYEGTNAPAEGVGSELDPTLFDGWGFTATDADVSDAESAGAPLSAEELAAALSQAESAEASASDTGARYLCPFVAPYLMGFGASLQRPL